MNINSRYVLVTPVKNEVNTIGHTIGSVVSQTLLPIMWVIVSDGSDDGTDEVVKRAANEHPWIKLISLKPRVGKSHCFASVVKNTTIGIGMLESMSYEFLGLLDADIRFDNTYYENIIHRFDMNPQLGLAGGVVLDQGHQKYKLPINRKDVPGAVQFFRRDCFKKIGGLVPLPEGGWDGLSCVSARMHGYQTCLFTDLVVDHLKPRNVREGGILRRKWQMGIRDYAIGYTIIFEFIKCLSRLSDNPYIIGSIAWWLGYCMKCFTYSKCYVEKDIQKYIRKEQLSRICELSLFEKKTYVRALRSDGRIEHK